MVIINKSISHLIEDQLPEFIATDYPQFARFLEKYYEQVESRGQPYDILKNLETYRDIDFYEETLLNERSPLVGIINTTDTTIEVEDASSFPRRNGYLKIDNEICFYKLKEGNTFLEVSRGVSGNTKLGDLYESSEFVTTQSESHSGTFVYNISNLFLYALIKKFEFENLNSFPEKYLKKEIDKRTLIKNISNFYKVKGTESSIKFIFNTIVARDVDNVPSTYNPKDFTLKSSTSDWLTTYSLKVVIVSGNPEDLIGNTITQNNANLGFATAVVDNIQPLGGADGQQVYQIILNPETVNGTFRIAAKTELEETISETSSPGDTVTVQSTAGWGRFGSFYVDNERFNYNDKNVKQFFISERFGSATHVAGTKVYDYSPVVYRDNELIVFGVLYDLKIKSAAPYSTPNDTIQSTDPGFNTKDRIVFNNDETKTIRWKLNSLNTSPTALTNPLVNAQLQKYIGDVLSVYEDEQFYYICSSGYPVYDILSASDTGLLSDSKNLKVIRKRPIQTSEIYETTNTSVGVFVDGTIGYSYRDEEFVKFGKIQKISVTQKGSGYKEPPFVLINNQNGKARAFLNGETLGRIEINDDTIYSEDPEVTVTSGRNARVRAIVTNGGVTKLVIENPGEYYSSPPIIRITDRSGRGKFASFKSIISNQGELIDFERIEIGRLYTQENVFVEVIAEGKFAEAQAEIRKWVKNRYQNSSASIDSANGRLFANPLTFNQKQYGIIANPVKLRESLSDTPGNHSPILGYAYDGNPIYGPYGYSNPGDPTSAIARITSGYFLNGNRSGGPSTAEYPVGSFIDDYTWIKNENTGKTRLDENNGRYCVTPEYPEGTYAYFITVDASDNPVFPYILGQNYYSLPVASNYDNSLTQDDLPADARKLVVSSDIDSNGYNTAAKITATRKGSISGATVNNTTDVFSVGSKVVIDDTATTGFGAYASVEEVKGKNVESIESVQTKAVKISSFQSIYFFDGDIITQRNTGATGSVVGNSFNTSEFLLRNVSGTFNSTDLINSNKTVVNVIVDKESEYTKGSTISLFDGISSVLAEAEVLESTKDQNAVKLLVTSGNFISDPEYSLFSSTLSDTSGSKVLSVVPLSNNIQVFQIDDNVVALKTESDHNLSVGDKVNVSVIPDDQTTETTYYIRKKKYQQVKLKAPIFSSVIRDTGIGRVDTLVSGTDYASSTYGGGSFSNVDVIFTNPEFARNSIGQTVGSATNSGAVIGNPGGENNAKATVVVGFTKNVLNSIASTNTIEVDDLENVFPGQEVRGQNIAPDTRVLSVNQNGLVTLSNINTNNIILGDVESVVFNAGIISSVTITSKGSTYREGDLISFVNEDLDKLDLAITRDFIGIVDHVGFSISDTTLFLNDIRSLSNGDVLRIGSELVKISSTDISSTSVTVTRGENNTPIDDHFNSSSVTIENPQYRFSVNSQIVGNSEADPYVYEYDASTQLLTVYFDYNQTNINDIDLSTVFLDSSTPAKNVIVSRLEYIENRFEYSSDNSNFEILNSLEFQKYYQYKFITEHPSMQNTYLEFSPSINRNIIALDSFRNDIASGNPGSFIKLKPGANFGYYYNNTSIKDLNTITNNSVIDVQEDFDVQFNRYYFFDKNNDVNTSDGFISIIDDPLQGRKTVLFKTNNVFVYSFDRTPQYDGSGEIHYTTNGSSAIGKASSIQIENAGSNYDIIPSVVGILPSDENRASLSVTYDSLNNRIANVSVEDSGSSYSKPKAIINGDGIDAEIELVVRSGRIMGATVKNPGYGYTSSPEVEIVETDVECFLSSDDIGIPESVEVTNSGFLFNTDKSLYRKYFSNTKLILSDISGEFLYGEKVSLEFNGITYGTGVVTKNGWRNGTNVLKLASVKGEFIKGLTVKGTRGSSAKIVDIFRTEFSPNVKSFYDNIGYYTSDRGKVGQYSQRLTDSFFYQDYSYVIKSQSPTDLWRDLILQTTHPAGFKVFGEVIVNTEQTSTISKGSSYGFTKIDLEAPKFANYSTTRTITQSRVVVKDSNEQYGRGTVYINAQNNAETYATDILINDPFDGIEDPSTGYITGTRTFALTDASTNLPITPYNEEQLLITIDGVVQEPGVAYTVSGSNITFATPPLGEKVVEFQKVPAQSFNGRSFRFKDNTLNQEYLRKIRNFFQRSGRWLDSANQIRFNKDFIVEESIGYAIETYPNVPWNLYQEKCTRDIGLILDAIEHDIRFGGNRKIHEAASSYFNSVDALDHIDNELTESLDAFKYTAKLCSAALRNWDYTVTNAVITSTSDVITVPDTFGIVVGMNVSSGSQFPEDTKVTEIINDTQIRVSNNARLAASTALVVTTGSSEVIAVDTIVTTVINEGDIEVGTVSVANGGTTTLTSTYSVTNIPQATFSLSKINNGTFYDASNLIEANRTYIQEETIGWVKTTYPTLNIPDETKCKRDTGLLVDAVVYNLRFGGTTKIVDFAKSYYIGNRVKHINNELTESVAAYKFAVSLMVLAMRGTLPTGVYTSEAPFYDVNILDDPNEFFPKCAEIESTLNSYAGIVETLLTEGIGLIQPEPENNQRSGNWTTRRTYSNYNLIADPLLLEYECNNVVESIKTLNGVLDGILNNGPSSVEKTNPDFIDGENTDFELYYENGDIVKTNPTESLLVFINGVTQLFGSYDIIRSEDPSVTDIISFSEAPKWEQEENIITVQEPLAVDKTFAIRVGSYERAIIDTELVKIRKTGPFPLYDSESPAEIKYIDDDRYAYVFVDGILQKRGESYNLTGSNITFFEPLVATVLDDGTEITQKVDILIFYGRDLDRRLTFFDYEPETYKNDITLVVTDNTPGYTSIADLYDYYFTFYSSTSFVAATVYVHEFINGDPNNVQTIGQLKAFNLSMSGVPNSITLRLSSGYNIYPIQEDSILVFSTSLTVFDAVQEFNDPLLRRSRFKDIQLVPGDLTVEYEYLKDDDGKRVLRRDAVPIFYEIIENSRAWWDEKPAPIVNLREGDTIKIDGENDFRNIIKIPDIVNPKEYRDGKEIDNEFYGEISATRYSGDSEGQGLSATAEIDENGSISKIIWNKRDIQLYVDNNYNDKQTARGYHLAPFLEFVPRDENGGGAKAEVLVVDGAVIDVVITDRGSGYTQPPLILTTRGYLRYKQTNAYLALQYEFVYQRDLKVSYAATEITVIPGGVVPIVYSSYELLKSPSEFDRVLTQGIKLYIDEFVIDTDTNVSSSVIVAYSIESDHDTFTVVINHVDLIDEVAISSDEPYNILTREINQYLEFDFTFERLITSSFTTPSKLDVDNDTHRWIKNQFSIEPLVISLDDENVYRRQTGIKNIYIDYDFTFERFITSSFTTPSKFDVDHNTFTVALQNINKFEDVSALEDTIHIMRREVNPLIEYDIDISRVISSSWSTSSDIVSNHDTFSWIISFADQYVISSMSEETSQNIKGIKNILIDYDIDVSRVITSSWSTSSDIDSDYDTHSKFNRFVELDEVVTTNSENVSRFITGTVSLETIKTRKEQKLVIGSSVVVGSLLTAAMPESADYMYVLNTQKFPDQGLILIGKEIVFYGTKEDGRLLDVVRGVYNTPIESHNPGDYLRLLPEMVSVAPGTGISEIKIESLLTDNYVSYLSTGINRLIVNSLTTSITEVSTNIKRQSSGGGLDVKTDGNLTGNNYAQAVLGPSLGTFANSIGFANASELFGSITLHPELLSIEHFDQYYPNLTIQEVSPEESPSTLTTDGGLYFNYGPLSINNPITTTTSGNFALSGTTIIEVRNTDYFDDSGRLYIVSGANYLVATYTGKTATLFTGCAFVSGTTQDPGNGSFVVPQQLV